ncbi:hypothetical protein PMIN04_013106 [Paraphaeosphaeria minitans]|uniref:NTF2-like domain protein n=1 Tax=Paraphaeosphaeria minitans TaxID=565426 RepID=A0A9P6G3T4_9PLEO|nr:NTF2-like domain protein [Paraphaeosphaeria minitans]
MAPTNSQRRVVELARANLFDVFGNFDPVSHREAIMSIYHVDGIIHEPKTVGSVKQVQDLVFVAWTFGPKGKALLEGTDHIIVEDGKIKVIYVVLGDQADVGL